ncbi:MAG TPA: RDD family protein [Marinagarivorans sp.]
MTHQQRPDSPTLVSSAPLWRRFAAMVYDSLILLAISMAYGAVVTLVGSVIFPASDQQYQPMFTTGGPGELVLLGWILCLVGFYVWFWYRSGQTVGMRAWRLSLVDFNQPNQRLSFVRCCQRAAWGTLSFFMLGLGYWYRLFDKNDQCLHDKLTHSAVVVLPKHHG